MLKKLSRIFGITGGALAMLPYVLIIGESVIDLMDPRFYLPAIPPEFFILRYTAPTLLCSAAIIAGVYVRKRPVIAGIVMILSYALNVFTPQLGFIPVVFVGAVRVLSALLLVTGGVLALISRFTGNKASAVSEPQSGKQDQAPIENRYSPLRKLSSITAVICAALNMLFWAVISVYALCSMPVTDLLLLGLSTPLLVTAFALWGSFILYRRPAAGAVFMFASGALIFLFSFVLQWLEVTNRFPGIFPLIFIPAGIFALAAAKNAPAGNEPQSNTPLPDE